MICTFFGHKDTPDKVEAVLREEIKRLIEEKDVSMFYVGNHGNFDSMVLKVLKRLKVDYPQIDYDVVFAYLPQNPETTVMYEKSIFPQGLESVPPRFAINKRNKWMIDKSDYVITYVRGVGGASRFREIAKKKGKTVIDL